MPTKNQSHLAAYIERYRNITEEVEWWMYQYCYGALCTGDRPWESDKWVPGLRCPINRPKPIYTIPSDDIEWLDKQFYPLMRKTIHKFIPEQTKDVLEAIDIAHIFLSELSAKVGYEKYRDEKRFAQDLKVLTYVDKWMRQILEKIKPQVSIDIKQTIATRPDNDSQYYEPRIEKREKIWEFYFDGKKAVVKTEYKGLKIIEHLLLNKYKEFYPLEILKETKLREDFEIEDNYTIIDDKGILRIKNAITQKEKEYNDSNDPAEKAELKEEIEKLCSLLYKSRNKGGKPKNLTEKNRVSVHNLIKRVNLQIKKQNPELYSHFTTFISAKAIVRYAPDKDISWYIS